MSLAREKVDFADPLSLFSSGGGDDCTGVVDPQIEYVNEEVDFRAVDLDKVQFGAGQRKKKEKASEPSTPTSDKIRDMSAFSMPSVGPRPAPGSVRPVPQPVESRPEVAPVLTAPAATTEAPATAAVVVQSASKPTPPSSQRAPQSVAKAPVPVPEEVDEDLFLPERLAVRSSAAADDIFEFTGKDTGISSTQLTFSKIGHDDDNVGDLKVARLLEREDDHDFTLFTKSAAKSKPVQKKLMDFDQEDDFLKQLDEITTSAKARPVRPVDSATSSSTAATVQSSATRALDLDSLDLSDYISQNTSSGGGLFDD